MRKRGLVIALVLVLLGNALACSVAGGPTKGSGTIIKAEKEVSGFSGVTLAAAGNLIIDVGSAEELRIEVDDNLVQQYEADVESKMLTIKLKDGAQVEPTEEVNFYLTVKELDTIVVTGAGSVEVESAVRAGQFSVDLSGAGDITMAGLNADSLNVEISGAGSFEIDAGWVNEQTVVLSGAGDYMAEEMQCGTASIEITGAGSATVWVATQLEVAGTGTGTVEYVGKPEVSTEGSISVKPVTE